MTEQLLFRGGVYQSANKSAEFLVFFNMKLILYLLISHLYTTAWGLFSVRVMHALFIMINLFMVIHLSVQKKKKKIYTYIWACSLTAHFWVYFTEQLLHSLFDIVAIIAHYFHGSSLSLAFVFLLALALPFSISPPIFCAHSAVWQEDDLWHAVNFITVEPITSGWGSRGNICW